ncbi:Thioesterase/thiol ester dehydrase-isomerase [Hypoxylon trugodes]|uniref:Thioesterase/thiol ester dehydrase-isomerase n=1 Tax=Hypoxylon trugodes TaxID=326681 RepID=UPI00218CDB35|nr:Thioesterase/thiol ester dehydrase-isomerase [Hypoxylon trugodes]KAI1386379.1 Thioesterase/thiol ester dehydrase-isomerase [Hypoxylon trugodes]
MAPQPLKSSPAPNDHNQAVPDPLAHFQAIPWCAALLSDRSNLDVIVPDRRPLPSGESNFVRKTMNSPTTVKACVTFIRMVKPAKSKAKITAPSSGGTGEVSPAGGVSPVGNGKVDKEKRVKQTASQALLGGGGKENGEDPQNPFILFNALADLGIDTQSFAGTMHGGLYGVMLDEVMGTAANHQAPHGAYTVRFTTNFRRAVTPPQIVLIRGRVVRKDGRKLYVKGVMEDKDGNIMAEGDGLWLAMGSKL